MVDGIACFSVVPAQATGDPVAYQRFLLARSRYPVRDAYAAFQPFNEAGRTWQAFRERLEDLLRPGDLILDLANRSGWTGAELAAAFPEQQVISLWEGDTDVLGHRGFRYWYGGRRCPTNLHLAFLANDSRLPLADGAVRWVHGHDVLHHRDPEVFIPDVLRVLDRAGCVLFPHVHAADAQPEPWFKRDGTLRHARDYRALLRRMVGPDRCGLVFGEASLFEEMGTGHPRLIEPAMDVDCNAVMAIVPRLWADCPLSGDAGLPAELATAKSLADHLLPRHPVYARRLRARLPAQLDLDSRMLCYWAERLSTVGDIAKRMGMACEQLRPLLAGLQQAEVLCVRQLDPTTAHLQRSHVSGVDLPTVDVDHPQQLWRRAVACFPDRPCVVFGEGDAYLSYAQADEVVRAIARRMSQSGIGPQAAVLIADGLGVESLLFIWAAQLRSATVVVCDPDADVPALHELHIAAVFARTARWAMDGAALVGPDGATPEGWTPMPSWYDDDDLTGEDPTVEPHADNPVGAVLFTSGSTGLSKGVQLSWSALARSGRMIAWHYRWSEEDRLLSLGGLHTMSGLRNPCFAAVAVGAAVIVPSSGLAMTALVIADTITSLAATVLGAAPATLQALLAIGGRITDLAPLRLLICTGSRLSPDMRQRFHVRFSVPVCNYYGLTETCGFCFGDDPDGVGGEDIGLPVDGPWFRTGDLARITAEGRCVLVGRQREIIKNIHGEVVSCREIEDALLALTGVVDAAVLSMNDGDGIERSVAWVVADKSPEDPESWLCILRDVLFSCLGPKRMPGQIRQIEAIPRSSNGKLRRKRLLDSIYSP